MFSKSSNTLKQDIMGGHSPYRHSTRDNNNDDFTSIVAALAEDCNISSVALRKKNFKERRSQEYLSTAKKTSEEDKVSEDRKKGKTDLRAAFVPGDINLQECYNCTPWRSLFSRTNSKECSMVVRKKSQDSQQKRSSTTDTLQPSSNQNDVRLISSNESGHCDDFPFILVPPSNAIETIPSTQRQSLYEDTSDHFKISLLKNRARSTVVKGKTPHFCLSESSNSSCLYTPETNRESMRIRTPTAPKWKSVHSLHKSRSPKNIFKPSTATRRKLSFRNHIFDDRFLLVAPKDVKHAATPPIALRQAQWIAPLCPRRAHRNAHYGTCKLSPRKLSFSTSSKHCPKQHTSTFDGTAIQHRNVHYVTAYKLSPRKSTFSAPLNPKHYTPTFHDTANQRGFYTPPSARQRK